MYGFYTMLIILILCSMSVILVLLKQPELDTEVLNTIDEEVNNKINDLDVQIAAKSSLATRSTGRSTAEKVLVPDVLEVTGRPKSIS